MDYAFGLAKNSRLTAMAAAMYEARVMHEMTGEAQRVFGEMRYRTLGSGSRERRVVAKAEHNGFGANPRFVVTSVSAGEMDCEALYEDFHCARGDMENRIKEQQLDMFADRTSTARMHANQLRLYFASFAYVLMQTLRRVGLAGTELAKAQCGTIRDNRRGSGVPRPPRHRENQPNTGGKPRRTAHPPPRTSVFRVQTAFRPPCEAAPGETVRREPAKTPLVRNPS